MELILNSKNSTLTECFWK